MTCVMQLMRQQGESAQGSYAYTQTLSPSGWAWEFLRRNPRFRAAAARNDIVPDVTQDIRGVTYYSLRQPVPQAEDWGLRVFPDPSARAGTQAIFWRRDIFRRTLLARVTDHAQGVDKSLFLSEIPGKKAILFGIDRRAKLAVEAPYFTAVIAFESSIDRVPDRFSLSFDLGGLADFEQRLETLQMFAAHCRGLIPADSDEGDYRTARLKDALIALDARLSGASLRVIAEALFGAERVADDWNRGSRFTRERARRAVARGLALRDGGWRALLQ